MSHEKSKIKKLPMEQYFFLSNGHVFKNLLDLVENIEFMDEDIFKCHVNENKNDFANWIRDVMQENELAEKLQKTKDKNETQMLLLKHVVGTFTNRKLL